MNEGQNLLAAQSDGTNGANGINANTTWDTIVLNSGAEIKGRVLDEGRDSGKKVVTVLLQSGGTMTLDSAAFVSRVRTDEELELEFQSRLAGAPPTSAGYYELLQWCESQPGGNNRFRLQRQYLYEKILELDPSDKKARRELGYRQTDDGRWRLTEAWQEGYGYRKVAGRGWESSIASQFQSANEETEENLRQLRSRMESWFKSASRTTTNLADAEREFQQLVRGNELAPVVLFGWVKSADKMKSPLRKIFLEGLGDPPSNPMKIGALIHVAMTDPDANIHDRAMVLLTQPGFNRNQVAAMAAGYLNPATVDFDRPETVITLERAARLIAELGVPEQAINLANALTIKGNITVNPNAGRTTAANIGGNTSFSPGAKPIKMPHVHNSDAVLSALKRLLGQDFGFNADGWKDWYIQNYTMNHLQMRADD